MNLTDPDCFWQDKPSRCWTVYVLFKVFSSISLIGCLFIVAIIFLFKLHKYFVQRLILFLSISAFLKVIANLFSVNNQPKLCMAQGFLIQFFAWSELLWVCCITVNILLVFQGAQSEKYEKWYHILTWTTALAIAIIPFLKNNYGPAGMWCWIERRHTALRFGTWYVPLMLIVFILIVIYIFISIRAYCTVNVDEGFQFESQQQRELLQDEVRPLLAYPVIYFLFTLPILIYRIDDAVHPQQPPRYSLLLASVITSPLLGCFNALAFSLFQDTLKRMSWSNIKGALLSCGESVQITHNYGITDASHDSQSLLHNRNDEEVTFFNGYGGASGNQA